MSAPNIAASTAKLYKKSLAQSVPVTPTASTSTGTILVNAAGSGFVIAVEAVSFASSDSANATTVNLTLIKSGAASVRLIGKDSALPAAGTITAIERNAPVTLEEGDMICATAANLSRADLTLSYNQFQES